MASHHHIMFLSRNNIFPISLRFSSLDCLLITQIYDKITNRHGHSNSEKYNGMWHMNSEKWVSSYPLQFSTQRLRVASFPLVVITTRYRGRVHAHNATMLQAMFALSSKTIKTCFTSLHLTAIESLADLILNESKLPKGIS